MTTPYTFDTGIPSLEAIIRCVGACGLAPVVMIGEKVYGRLQPVDVKKIIEELENRIPENNIKQTAALISQNSRSLILKCKKMMRRERDSNS